VSGALTKEMFDDFVAYVLDPKRHKERMKEEREAWERMMAYHGYDKHGNPLKEGVKRVPVKEERKTTRKDVPKHRRQRYRKNPWD
jgi:hypothetical protein